MQVITPFTPETIRNLKAGDTIFLSSDIYTARDAAHKLMAQALENGLPAPFEYEGNAVFYAGPCPAPPGKPIGSIGPTTAGRMDAYSPALIAAGLRVMIGKGERAPAVVDAIKKHGGIYLVAVGGVAALMAKCIIKSEEVAYRELGTESVKRLTVENLPLVVAIDHTGETIL